VGGDGSIPSSASDDHGVQLTQDRGRDHGLGLVWVSLFCAWFWRGIGRRRGSWEAVRFGRVRVLPPPAAFGQVVPWPACSGSG
jgi:hypothetical protein